MSLQVVIRFLSMTAHVRRKGGFGLRSTLIRASVALGAILVTMSLSTGSAMAGHLDSRDGPQIENPDGGSVTWFEHDQNRLYVFDSLADGYSAVGGWQWRASGGGAMGCSAVWNSKGQGYQVYGTCGSGEGGSMPEGELVEYSACLGKAADREVIGDCSYSTGAS